MYLFKSFIISFSMYSIIPMPRLKWDEEGMKYTFIFLPWIGLIIGAAAYLWLQFASFWDLNSLLTAVIFLLIPIVLSGGIHMDGLIDTCDAVFSYGDKEKKLEILKDPRTGAFGVIGCSVYLLLALGISSQLTETPKYIILLILIYAMSRSIGGIALLTVKKAKPNGLGTTFATAAKDKVNVFVLSLYLLAAFGYVFLLNIGLGIAFLLVISVYLWWYNSSILKNFGGITGDLTGFLITSVELILMAVIAIGGIIC